MIKLSFFQKIRPSRDAPQKNTVLSNNRLNLRPDVGEASDYFSKLQKMREFSSVFFYFLVRIGAEIGYGTYRVCVRPWVQGQCRFFPTCSMYVKESFQTLPFFRAVYFSLWRLLRCHPWGSFESDPTPSFSQARCLCKNSKKI